MILVDEVTGMGTREEARTNIDKVFADDLALHSPHEWGTSEDAMRANMDAMTLGEEL